MITQDPTDEVCFEKLRRGEMEAFDILYSRYERRLFQFIRRYLPRQEDAEEVFHEAFMGVLKSRDVKFDRGSFCTWLYKNARNLSLNRLRSEGRSEKALRTVFREDATDGLASGFNFNSLQENQPVLAALTSAVDKLSRPLAEVFDLRKAGMSYVEMAQILDIPMGTVKSRMFEMIAQLRKDMQLWNAE